ncbi:unnamed protein product [Ceutorhynchus assimilis]|uniref:Putative zinc-finger domain-containing protein n=1 Tax=Ceutorhynchus assimilis TaxID=467358 RepID=A0A9N9QRV3_9CUCU|nr:unnamed protein product [Ceutorhynchus assimilis]
MKKLRKKMPPEEVAHQTYTEDGPEEGEILSDDHLEDISSDESYDLDLLPNGKSIRNNHHLHALSLSSISDTSIHGQSVPKTRRKRHGHEHRGHCKRKRTCRRRRECSTSSSDQEDTTLDVRLKAQLKAAIKFDSIENAHKNSLRTRLNAMVNGPVNEEPKSDSDLNHDTIEIIASGSENRVDTPEIEDIDNELIQLRLAALKTAICNKYAKRTKRKNDMNKENNTVEEVPQAQMNSNEIIDEDPAESNLPPAPSIEEDEDVLRAILLASMSKKITSYQPEPIINNKNFKINNFNNVNRAFNKKIKMPQVKPLIIRINSDSEDSDWDLSSPEKNVQKTNPVIKPEDSEVKFSNKLQKHNGINSEQLSTTNQEEISQKKIISSSNNNKLVEENPQDNAPIVTENTPNGIKNIEIVKLQEAEALSIIESSVEKFLKEQRAKVESRQNLKIHPKKFPVNLKPPPKKNLLNIKTQPKKHPLNIKVHLKKNSQNKPNSPDLEKSALKFLPAKKMEEYQKLQSLLKQKKAQKLLTKNKSDKSTQTVTVKNSLPEIPKTEDFESMRKKEKQSCSSVLRATLKQLEMKNSNGRFQIQDKYKDLRPLIRNINQVNKEQKQCEQNVDRLVKELAEARRKQEELHRKMLTGVTNLADEKKKIELSSLKPAIPNKASIISNPPLITSAISAGQKLISEKSELKTLTQTAKNKDQPKVGTENKVTDLNNIDKVNGKTTEKLTALRQEDDEIKKLKSALKPVKSNNALVTSTPIKPSLPAMTLLASTITSDQSLVCDKSGSSVFDQTTIQDDDDSENKIRDPNDIDEIIEKTKNRKQCDEVKKVETSEYKSPLEHHERQTRWNPLVSICPFEINGTCKDSECIFNHLTK